MEPTFRSVITPDKPNYEISHADSIMSIGSCFSENTGNYFKQYKFKININPFGQQYNPLSICNALERLMHPDLYTEKDLVLHDELYHSFHHHGDFSGADILSTIANINQKFITASNDLKQASVLFLTFGTAHVFKLKSTSEVVSNCHKMPGNLFEQVLIKPKEIVETLAHTLEKLWRFNPDLKIVLTVSPVRYNAFGVHQNTVSKSYLFAAIQHLQDEFKQLYYFPAYEILMDDLRDYRFYAEDFLHPNDVAIKYAWQKLTETMISSETLEIMKSMDEIISALNHRPRNAASSSHKKFIAATLNKIAAIESKTNLNFEEEKKIISNPY